MSPRCEPTTVTLPAEYETLSGGAFNVSSSERAEMDFAFLKEDVRLFGDRLTGWTGALMLGGAEVAKGLRCRLRATLLAFTELFSQCDVIFASTVFISSSETPYFFAEAGATIENIAAAVSVRFVPSVGIGAPLRP